jgi:predicted HAD superfamily Cof-like phosphohydrolase
MNKKIKFDEGDDLQIKSILESATDIKLSSKSWNVPFVNEVEEFNETFGKPNNYIPTIGEKKEWMFVYDFIQEELAEYKEACEKGDIVGVLDALCDITYVSLGNGAMLHGLKGHIWKAYQEVQASNMSKACKTE